MSHWRTVRLLNWSIMVGPSTRGGLCWLVCRGNTIVMAGHSLAELLGLRSPPPDAPNNSSRRQHDASLIK